MSNGRDTIWTERLLLVIQSVVHAPFWLQSSEQTNTSYPDSGPAKDTGINTQH